MKFLNVLSLASTGVLAVYISLKLFTGLFSPSLNESFIIEFFLVFLIVGLLTFRNWKVEVKADERYR
ncbi:hypothetical protein E2R51_09260 [Jeotgalibacillus sp. S-D1]|uniref:hypothetical protein n=1 Tax=Jeotgalibacillus sp. S-D1 TaxID=2552189 RepID=UPI001059E015|nr:hypothetical protein [Jeotgalibacillus sp. S-D1]TDL32847.1 hypothetical protein E2R51_09260 [Jeotgalibacillus sp. S-D1]